MSENWLPRAIPFQLITTAWFFRQKMLPEKTVSFSEARIKSVPYYLTGPKASNIV